MTTSYAVLDEAGARHLRMQRLLDLESDHFRYALDLQELPEGADSSKIIRQLDDIERRIRLHRRELGLSEVVTEPSGRDDEPEPPDKS